LLGVSIQHLAFGTWHLVGGFRDAGCGNLNDQMLIAKCQMPVSSRTGEDAHAYIDSTKVWAI